MRARAELSASEARWLAIAAQGLARTRPSRSITRGHLRDTFDAVGTVQLDAINVLARTQFLVLFSRLGTYDIERLHEMTGPQGDLFEYWGHAASLLPMDRQPLFRWRMAQSGPVGDSPTYSARLRAWERAHARYIDAVFTEVRDRGPIAASKLSDPRRRDGTWWDRRSVGRQALEVLFAKGVLACWRTPSFERVYDLPERVIPSDVLHQATPSLEEAQRQLIALAARSLGVATVGDLATYYFIKTNVAKLRVDELVGAGELLPVAVEGWREPGYVLPGARPARPRRAGATVLSPFDSLIWDRRRTQRLFGFDYRIEVYVPEPKRTYGYFVLPLLLGDELVARLDLRADRKASVLRVGGAFRESSADARAVALAASAELDALRTWLRLDDIAVRRNGDLAAALQRATAGR